tara:strand:- start:920 stop:1672 length:753 start_codon:yes stop_codon:yes gene_type:complete
MEDKRLSRSYSVPVRKQGRKQGSILGKTTTAPPRLGTQPRLTAPVPVHSHRKKGAMFIAAIIALIGLFYFYMTRETPTSSDEDNCDSIENGYFIHTRKRPRKIIDIDTGIYKCNDGYKYANNIPSPTSGNKHRADCKTGTLKGLCVPTVTPPSISYCSSSSTFEWTGASPSYGETAFPSSRIRCRGVNPTPSPGHPFFTCQRNGIIRPTPCVPTSRSTSGYTNYIDHIIDWISGRPDINQHSKYSLLPGY